MEHSRCNHRYKIHILPSRFLQTKIEQMYFQQLYHPFLCDTGQMTIRFRTPGEESDSLGHTILHLLFLKSYLESEQRSLGVHKIHAICASCRLEYFSRNRIDKLHTIIVYRSSGIKVAYSDSCVWSGRVISQDYICCTWYPSIEESVDSVCNLYVQELRSKERVIYAPSPKCQLPGSRSQNLRHLCLWWLPEFRSLKYWKSCQMTMGLSESLNSFRYFWRMNKQCYDSRRLRNHLIYIRCK